MKDKLKPLCRYFHDLRKSCISTLALKGYSLKEVQKWVGQEDLETTVRIYNKVRQQDKDKTLHFSQPNRYLLCSVQKK